MSNVRTDSRDYDVISVGSGHHGLIAAAYLAKVGKRVLVLERQDYIGGGCVTKELAPGFRYDEHSTVHQVILSNPLLKADELGLKARFGLEYIAQDALIGAIHPHHLRRYCPDVDEGVLLRAELVQLATYSSLVSHYALREPVRF